METPGSSQDTPVAEQTEQPQNIELEQFGENSLEAATVEPNEATASNEALRYVRADGTVETARDATEAIKKCPYLASLPVEKANVVLKQSESIAPDAREKALQKLRAQKEQKAMAAKHESVEETAVKAAEKEIVKPLPDKSVESAHDPKRPERMAEDIERRQNIEDSEPVLQDLTVKTEAPATKPVQRRQAEEIKPQLLHSEKPANEQSEVVSSAEPEGLPAAAQYGESATSPAAEVAEVPRQENLVKDFVQEIERPKPAEELSLHSPQSEMIAAKSRTVETNIRQIDITTSNNEEIDLRSHLEPTPGPTPAVEMGVDTAETDIESVMAPEPLELSLPVPEQIMIRTENIETTIAEEPEEPLEGGAPDTMIAESEPAPRHEETAAIASITELAYVETTEQQDEEKQVSEESLEVAEEPQFEQVEASTEILAVSQEAVEVFQTLSELQGEEGPAEEMAEDNAEVEPTMADVIEADTAEPEMSEETAARLVAAETEPEAEALATAQLSDEALPESDNIEITEVEVAALEPEQPKIDIIEAGEPKPAAIETTPPESAVNRFEEFVENLGRSDETEAPQALFKIQTEAAAKPAKQVLAELATYLEQAELEPVAEPLRHLLKEVADIWPTTETDDEKPKLTPELTDKLLELLRLAGYKEPDKALLEMARTHGIEFLLDALQYLSLLANQAERKEFYNLATTKPIVHRDSLSSRLGRLMVRFIGALEPSLAVAD